MHSLWLYLQGGTLYFCFRGSLHASTLPPPMPLQTIAGGRYTFYTSEACAVAAGAPAAAASDNNCGLNGTQKWGGLAQVSVLSQSAGAVPAARP